MPSIPLPPLPVSQAGRAAHDIGLAGMLGGNLYGRLALHPAVRAISDERERGKVVNASWKRYGMVNGLGLAAVVAGWAGARANEARDDRLSGAERRLAYVKDGLVALTAATGIATAVQGVRFSRMEPNGAVPLTDGDTAAPSASEREARAKRMLNVLGLANIAAESALVAVNAALNQQSFRRPPAKRLIGRRV
jgi:hypothetical protein